MLGISAVINALLIALGLILFIYRFNQESAESSLDLKNRSAFKQAIVADTLLLIWTIKLSFERNNIDIPWWFFTIGAISFLWCAAIGLGAISEIISQRSLNFFGKHFWFTLISTIVIVFADYSRRNNFFSIDIIYLPNNIDIFYFISYVAYHLNLLFFASIAIPILWNSLGHYKDIIYIARRLLCVLAYSVGVLVCISSLLNIFIKINYYNYNNINIIISNLSNYILIPLFGMLFCVGFMGTDKLLNFIMKPFNKFINRRQKVNQDFLEYLHKIIIKIVPNVHFPLDYDDIDMMQVSILTEISDARRIIYSHHLNIVTAEDEALLLCRILKDNKLYKSSGIHPIRPVDDLFTHNIKVAKYMAANLKTSLTI
ncbi:hypothetical protein [Herpetosiphon giganteus]|uniref:hypothetical protein n=1 Tax=Herpetosiphon giganteus TaxID=2029754 RepID=UPI00195DE7EF|nr:hypothetical protein [Herpetosiphon giganteus]MBM7845626.1 hypothetical protein [Herpetosiphon giganteus]